MRDVENGYQQVVDVTVLRQRVSGGRWYIVMVGFVGASCLFAISVITVGIFGRSPERIATVETDFAYKGEVEKDPAMHHFAHLDLQNTTLATSRQAYLHGGTAEASHLKQCPDVHLFVLPLSSNGLYTSGRVVDTDEKPFMSVFTLPLKCLEETAVPSLNDKLVNRALTMMTPESLSLDRTALGKSAAPSPTSKDDPFKELKDGLKSFAASAAATSWGEAVTIPFDTIKVRLQTQAAGATKYSGLIGTGITVAEEEGLAALWKGITPGVHRQVFFGGLRFGLYEPVRDFYTKAICGENYKGPPPFAVKLMSGLTTGALAIAVASPTDLVKVRMQSQKLVAGVAPRYPSALAAYGIILREEGLASMWNGVVPNMMRNAIISAVELGTYDQFKESLLKIGLPDGPPVHTAAAFATGLLSVLVGSPVDVMKSRTMGDTTGAYKGLFDCACQTMAKDGPLAFYKGFAPNFARAGSWCVVSFLTLEQIKELTGMTKKAEAAAKAKGRSKKGSP